MTRNAGLDGKADSAVSLPEEEKVKAELEKLAESDEEDELFVNKIEEAQNVRLEAEKDDNQALKKQVTQLHAAVRRATMMGTPG